MQTKQVIGKIIRNARIKKNLTQLDLAKKLGYDSTQFVSLFERGLSKCPTKTLGKICKMLDIDKDDVFNIIVDHHYRQTAKELGIV